MRRFSFIFFTAALSNIALGVIASPSAPSPADLEKVCEQSTESWMLVELNRDPKPPTPTDTSENRKKCAASLTQAFNSCSSTLSGGAPTGALGSRTAGALQQGGINQAAQQAGVAAGLSRENHQLDLNCVSQYQSTAATCSGVSIKGLSQHISDVENNCQKNADITGNQAANFGQAQSAANDLQQASSSAPAGASAGGGASSSGDDSGGGGSPLGSALGGSPSASPANQSPSMPPQTPAQTSSDPGNLGFMNSLGTEASASEASNSEPVGSVPELPPSHVPQESNNLPVIAAASTDSTAVSSDASSAAGGGAAPLGAAAADGGSATAPPASDSGSGGGGGGKKVANADSGGAGGASGGGYAGGRGSSGEDGEGGTSKALPGNMLNGVPTRDLTEGYGPKNKNASPPAPTKLASQIKAPILREGTFAFSPLERSTKHALPVASSTASRAPASSQNTPDDSGKGRDIWGSLLGLGIVASAAASKKYLKRFMT